MMRAEASAVLPSGRSLTRLEREVMPMDEDAIRARAQAMCDALVAGDVGKATEDFSKELKQHLGEVLSLLPLPANAAAVQSVGHAGSGFEVVLQVVGESEEVLVQTRWKDRDGRPTVVEASHLSRAATAPAEPAAEGEAGETPA
jgi:hypothetical protein